MPYFELGSRARDMYTGFEGVIVNRSEWIGGGIFYGLQSEKLQNGKPPEVQFFHAMRLEPVLVEYK